MLSWCHSPAPPGSGGAGSPAATRGGRPTPRPATGDPSRAAGTRRAPGTRRTPAVPQGRAGCCRWGRTTPGPCRRTPRPPSTPARLRDPFPPRLAHRDAVDRVPVDDGQHRAVRPAELAAVAAGVPRRVAQQRPLLLPRQALQQGEEVLLGRGVRVVADHRDHPAASAICRDRSRITDSSASSTSTGAPTSCAVSNASPT